MIDLVEDTDDDLGYIKSIKKKCAIVNIKVGDGIEIIKMNNKCKEDFRTIRKSKDQC